MEQPASSRGTLGVFWRQMTNNDRSTLEETASFVCEEPRSFSSGVEKKVPRAWPPAAPAAHAGWCRRRHWRWNSLTQSKKRNTFARQSVKRVGENGRIGHISWTRGRRVASRCFRRCRKNQGWNGTCWCGGTVHDKAVKFEDYIQLQTPKRTGIVIPAWISKTDCNCRFWCA